MWYYYKVQTYTSNHGIDIGEDIQYNTSVKP